MKPKANRPASRSALDSEGWVSESTLSQPNPEQEAQQGDESPGTLSASTKTTATTRRRKR